MFRAPTEKVSLLAPIFRDFSKEAGILFESA